MSVGHVTQLWRYPVKSMQGERLDRAEIDRTYGVAGDRGWAIRDEASGEIRGASRLSGLMRLSASYAEEPAAGSTPPAIIGFEDGRQIRTDDPAVNAMLSGELGRDVTLWPRQPAENRDHYRRRSRPDEAQLREQLGLIDGESIPDFSTTAPPEMFALLQEYKCPPGTYFDAYPLHLVTTGSLATLAEQSPGSVVEARRFRPNLVVDTGDTGDTDVPYPERAWLGRRLRVGAVVGEVVMGVPRCSVITMPHGDLPVERSLLRTLVRETGMDFGVYLAVIEPGSIAEGDEVTLLEP